MVKPVDPPSKSQKTRPWIHDDLLIQIVSRLPAKAVLRWRCVSKKWRDITSTPDFERLHVRHSIIPMIRFEKENSAQFLDNWWEPEPEKSVIHRFATITLFSDLQFSQDGFLVMKSASDFFIINPLNREVVRITHRLPTRDNKKVFGFFWNPKLKEYCVVFVVYLSRLNSEYSIVNLGSKTCLREIKNPWNHKILCLLSDPLLIDDSLYRMVFLDGLEKKNILKFDVMSEEFTVISCPHDVGGKGRTDNIKLLNIDGKLSLVRIKPNRKVINIIICTLKDRERQVWICRNYSISCCKLSSTDLSLKAIAFMDGKLVIGSDDRLFLCDLSDLSLKVIAFVDGKLVIGSDDRLFLCDLSDLSLKVIAFVDGKLVIGSDDRLFLCDLKKGIAKRIGRKNSGIRYPFLSHVMSIASLRDCKSVIVL